MKILLDTCVIIDYLQGRKDFFPYAEEIFFAVANRICTGYVTAKSLTDIYYLMHHYTHNEEKSKALLKKILMIFEVLDTTATDCINALNCLTTDYADGVMIETAKRQKMDFIITRNTKDFQSSSVTVLNPNDFIHILRQNKLEKDLITQA